MNNAALTAGFGGSFSILRHRVDAAGFLAALLSWDSAAFAVICLADMLTTLYWVHAGVASEANPVLARALQAGPACFAGEKIASFAPALIAAAAYRTRRPRFVAFFLRAALAGYVIIYAASVLRQFC